MAAMPESSTHSEFTDEEPEIDPMIGRVVAERFHIVDHVASGGMGSIYRARQEPLGREVAFKILEMGGGPGAQEFRKRFKLEASACAKLSHSNIVRIFDFGITDDHIYFIAMELIEGRSLIDLLRTESPMRPSRALHILRQVVSGLTEAHEQGIIHRDIKPENILITTNGDDADFVKLVDFGLVKEAGNTDSATRTGYIIGSPYYMPPEQIEGLTETDHRSDIYPLGIILFNMLSGRRPFERKGTPAILFAQMHEPIPPVASMDPTLRVPASLEAVLQKCVQKKPADRYETMRELGEALKACEADVLAMEQGQGDVAPAVLENAFASDRQGSTDEPAATLSKLDTASLHPSSLVLGGAISAVAIGVGMLVVVLAVVGLVMAFGSAEEATGPVEQVAIEAPAEPAPPAPVEVAVPEQPAEPEQPAASTPKRVAKPEATKPVAAEPEAAKPAAEPAKKKPTTEVAPAKDDQGLIDPFADDF